MDLRQLDYLDAVVRTGSFTGAAAEMHVAQPAVSQMIKRLERELGTTLIDRGSKRPTEAGEVLLRRARRAVAELDAARSEVTDLIGLETGTVRAGAIHWLEPLDLAGLLGAFTAKHPRIAVDLREFDARVMFDMLRDREMDLVFSNISPGDALPAGLERRLLFTEPLVVGVGTDHPFAGRRSIRLDELHTEALIAFRSGSAFRDTVDAAFGSLSPAPPIRYESSDLIAVRNLVAAGLGVALMPQSLADSPEPRIAALTIAPDPPQRTVALTWRRDLSGSPAGQAFLNLALDWISVAT
ncbi:MAG: LysR family transcriptional regulator [bacterium]|nr:LysR family transcriptional regulator [bacterium]